MRSITFLEGVWFDDHKLNANNIFLHSDKKTIFSAMGAGQIKGDGRRNKWTNKVYWNFVVEFENQGTGWLTCETWRHVPQLQQFVDSELACSCVHTMREPLNKGDQTPLILYHIFLVLIKLPWCVSIEKQRDAIYVQQWQRKNRRQLSKFGSRSRKLLHDEKVYLFSPVSFSSIFDWIEQNRWNSYNTIAQNCKDFCDDLLTFVQAVQFVQKT